MVHENRVVHQLEGRGRLEWESLSRTRLVVVDEFYADPDVVRAEAFEYEYDQPHPHFPWYVSKSPSRFHKVAVQACEAILRHRLFDTDCHDEATTIGRFQFSLGAASPLISVHSDPYMWAAIIYLTRDAPISSGTRFYRHKATGRRSRIPPEDRADLRAVVPLDTSYKIDDFEVAIEVGNVFNRAILFDATQFHGAAGFFGDEPAVARLTQTFWFNLNHSVRSRSFNNFEDANDE